MKRSKNLWRINSQGGIEFRKSPRLAEVTCKPDSAWERVPAALVLLILCGLTDFVLNKQTFGSFLHDAPWVQYCSIAGMLVGLDVAPTYLGILCKKRSQGFYVSVLQPLLFLSAFLMALLVNTMLRIRLRNLILPPTVSATAFSFLGTAVESAAEHPAAMPYAIFTSTLAAVTSLVNFGVGYMVNDPLKNRLVKLSKASREMDRDIGQLEAMLAEYDADSEYMEQLMAEDQEQYENAAAMIEELGVYYCDYVRQRIKEHLGDAAATNALSKDCRGELIPLFNEERSEAKAVGDYR